MSGPIMATDTESVTIRTFLAALVEALRDRSDQNHNELMRIARECCLNDEMKKCPHYTKTEDFFRHLLPVFINPGNPNTGDNWSIVLSDLFEQNMFTELSIAHHLSPWGKCLIAFSDWNHKQLACWVKPQPTKYDSTLPDLREGDKLIILGQALNLMGDKLELDSPLFIPARFLKKNWQVIAADIRQW